MTVEYIHQKIGEEVTALAGYYTVTDELRLKHDGREILCIIGACCVESSCCGNRAFRYAVVPGYIVSWHKKKDKAGRPISEVEPLTDATIKREITANLGEKHNVFKQNIEFW
jgi:hypothetical protein